MIPAQDGACPPLVVVVVDVPLVRGVVRVNRSLAMASPMVVVVVVHHPG